MLLYSLAGFILVAQARRVHMSYTGCRLLTYIHCESKTPLDYNIIHNFAKCWPIFKICSLTDSVVNMQQKRH